MTLPIMPTLFRSFRFERRCRRRRGQGLRPPEFLEARTMLAAFLVDSLFDTPDDTPGDGIGEDSLGRKTLRAALDEADALPGPHTITITVGGTIVRGAGSPGFFISEDVSISGPGADKLTYDASGSGFVFRIFSAKVDMTGFTITGGKNGDGIGGAGIGNYGGDLTLDAMAIIGNENIGTGGGGIAFGVDFTMGGTPGTLTVLNSLIAENVAPGAGGIGIGNSAGDVVVINSTISGNEVTTDGAGIHYWNNDTSLVVRNSTITGNRVLSDLVSQDGAGIYVQAFPHGGDPLPVLHNTLVAGNLKGVASPIPDEIRGSGATVLVDSASSFNLIGDADTAGGLTHGTSGNIVGDSGTGSLDIATILSTTLTSNGGPTDTHALVLGSLAANGGSNALAIDPSAAPLSFDQRGTGFDRILQGTVDIGAYESPYRGGGLVVEDLIVFDETSGRWQTGISSGSKFTWTDGPKWSTTAGWQTFSGDVNGDGFLDGIGFNSTNQMFVALNNGSGGLTTVSAGGFSPSATFAFVMIGDYDGNGTDDLIAQLSNGDWYSRRWNGVSFETAFFGKFTPTGWSVFRTGDFNGDGFDDIIGLRDSEDGMKANFTYGISNVTPVGRRFAGLFAGAFGESVTSAGWTNVMVGDWNADGRDDVIAKHGGGRFWYATTNGSDITTPDLGAKRLRISVASMFLPTSHAGNFFVGDFDGNGLDDIITHNPNISNGFDGILRVGLTSFGTVPTMSAFNWGTWGTTITWGAEIVGDYNGDGLDDLAGLDTGRQLAFVSLSTASSFSATTGFGPITGTDDILDPGVASGGQVA